MMALDTAIISPMDQGLSLGCMDFERMNANPYPGLDSYLDSMFKAGGSSAEVNSDSNGSMDSISIKGCDDDFGLGTGINPFPTLVVGAQTKRVAGVKRKANHANLDHNSACHPGSGASSVGSCDSASNLSSLVDHSSPPSTGCVPAGGIVNNPPFVDNSTVVQLLQEQNVKKRRLARKAELARESRRRKKVRMAELEVEVDGLKAELARLKRATEAAGQRAREEAAKAQIRVSSAPDTVATEAPVKKPEEVAMVVNSSDVQDEGVAEQPALVLSEDPCENTSFKQLLNALSPSLSLRFLGWVLGQTEKFYQDPDGLWVQIFAREVGLSTQQMTGMVALRSQKLKTGIMQDVRARLAGYLAERDRCGEDTLGKLESILTPKQMRKLHAWIENFGSVCIKINI